ncbi:MAG: YbaK/EbsC family protein, partial [bacterium]|nr:YbaK/EbsC family protein [bacterium]
MSVSLSASAQKVQDALTSAGIECTVMELPDSTRSAQEAA